MEHTHTHTYVQRSIIIIIITKEKVCMENEELGHERRKMEMQ
jgi:hypothetical protein